MMLGPRCPQSAAGKLPTRGKQGRCQCPARSDPNKLLGQQWISKKGSDVMTWCISPCTANLTCHAYIYIYMLHTYTYVELSMFAIMLHLADSISRQQVDNAGFLAGRHTRMVCNPHLSRRIWWRVPQKLAILDPCPSPPKRDPTNDCGAAQVEIRDSWIMSPHLGCIKQNLIVNALLLSRGLQNV